MKNSILTGLAILGGIAVAGYRFKTWKQRTKTDELERLESFRRRMPDMSAEELEFNIRTGLRNPCLFCEEERGELLTEAWRTLDEKKSG